MRTPSQRVLISGSTGLIGTELQSQLKKKGVIPFCLVRRPARNSREIFWDPSSQKCELENFEGFDALIHLAGKNIAAHRWTPSFKEELMVSRIGDTRFLVQTLLKLRHPPKTLVCASAVGFYGSRGAEMLTEKSEAGEGFLSSLAQGWENACDPLRQSGIRVLNTRFGAVLSPKGGMLTRLLPLFRIGLGAVLGPGTQYLSWISLSDAAKALLFALESPDLTGPINITSPHPVTQREFAKTVARALHRPCLLLVPGWLVRLMMGELGEELLLSSTRAFPQKLLDKGFTFQEGVLTDFLSTL